MTIHNNKHIESFLHMDDMCFSSPFVGSSTSFELGLNPLSSTALGE
jgi:hypothetical protein